MTAPDVYAIAAQRVYSLPADWKPIVYECLDRGLGYCLTGAVPIGTYVRGPRRGRPKFPPKGQWQRVVITPDEAKEARDWWEHKTGFCGHCGGSGEWVKSAGVNGTTYRECVHCGGTGMAKHLRW